MMYMGGQSGALGLGVVGQWLTYVRDLMLDRFEELTGARIYHMFILPGGVRGASARRLRRAAWKRC